MSYKQQFQGKLHLLATERMEFCLGGSPRKKLTSKELKRGSFSPCKWEANQVYIQVIKICDVQFNIVALHSKALFALRHNIFHLAESEVLLISCNFTNVLLIHAARVWEMKSPSCLIVTDVGVEGQWNPCKQLFWFMCFNVYHKRWNIWSWFSIYTLGQNIPKFIVSTWWLMQPTLIPEEFALGLL